ncbi:MAG: tRNA pseudouridine(55) synthase TruB [Candidatus Saccharibacteria bacterium]|nr:tRNA pseudouridine(55) synthase TruB [Candidatus Saccharibacteria bacterium]
MNGILLVDKPKGWTSFDVVAKVRGMLRQHALVERYKVESEKSSEPLDFQTFKPSTRLPKTKVGHTGTLDPLATGLLVLTIGTYCKRASEFSKLDKTYQVTVELGKTSTTGDKEGQLTTISSTQPTELTIKNAIAQFIERQGYEYWQVPPAYSAIKVDGQRAYKLARAGKKVELEPRRAKVYSAQVTGYDYPELTFTADVSSGTYIRSLVDDIGKELGTGAYMADLRRTAVGDFNIDDAVSLDNINADVIEEHLKGLPEASV